MNLKEIIMKRMGTKLKKTKIRYEIEKKNKYQLKKEDQI
jgi:hypothetical protein